MNISVSKLTMLCGVLLALGSFTSHAVAQVSFEDDFESYALYVGPGYDGDIGGGWLIFANVFGDYPECTQYWYDYGGVFPAPNKDDGFSNISMGGTGQALNVYSDYTNADQAKGACIETSVFQERPNFSAANAGSYTFQFYTEAAATPLGTDVDTYGFIKLLDPNNGYNADVFERVSTVTAGTKSITVTLDATAAGKVLQWGFTTIASNYQPSGRFYDNVSFAPEGAVPPPLGPAKPIIGSVPIPLWAFLVIGGLLAYFGGSKLRAGHRS